MRSPSDVTVQVTLPRSLLVESGLSQQEASEALLRAFVLSLYRRDLVSSGKAARLLGVHRLTFIRMLAEEGIPYLDYTPEELETETEAVRQWPRQ
jgi:predicted HTH domain antitoxin